MSSAEKMLVFVLILIKIIIIIITDAYSKIIKILNAKIIKVNKYHRIP